MITANEALLASKMSRKRLISDVILVATSHAKTSATINIRLTEAERKNMSILGYSIKERINKEPYGDQTIFDWSKAG